MTLFAEQSIVCAAKPHREDVVPGVDLLPRRWFVAALAADAKLGLVGFGISVAVLALRRRWLVLLGRVAAWQRTALCLPSSFQRSLTFGSLWSK